jgi:hypothetical protein
MSLFKGYKKSEENKIVKTEFIPIKCAGLTDKDPDSRSLPTPSAPVAGNNKQLYLIEELQVHSTHCRLFSNMKTFEYDLAMEGNNLQFMAAALLDQTKTEGTIRTTLMSYQEKNWESVDEKEKAEASLYLLDHIDKGEFAQHLSEKMSDGLKLRAPGYIIDAIKWLVD